MNYTEMPVYSGRTGAVSSSPSNTQRSQYKQGLEFRVKLVVGKGFRDVRARRYDAISLACIICVVFMCSPVQSYSL